MTVLVVPDRDQINQYTATSGQTIFTYDFVIRTNSEIKVWLTPVGSSFDETSDLKTLGVDYTVQGAGEPLGAVSHTITFLSPTTAGDTITIKSDPEYSQTKDYTVSGAFTGASVQDTFNKWTILIEDLRSLLLQTGLTYSPLEVLTSGQRRIPKLGSDQYWKANSLGNLVAADVGAGPDPTLRSELLSQTVSAPGTDNVGVYNPRTAAGQTLTSWVASYSPPQDDQFAVVRDTADATKQVRIDAGALTTATTRVITMPDNDVDLAILATLATPASAAQVIAGTDNTNYLSSKSLRDAAVTILQDTITYMNDRVTTSATIPYDNTIPQITEGAQVLQISFTPKSAASKIYIYSSAYLHSNLGTPLGMSLATFWNDEADSIGVTHTTTSGIEGMTIGTISEVPTSGTTSAVNIEIRMGSNLGAPMEVNGNSVNRVFGGKCNTFIRVVEMI